MPAVSLGTNLLSSSGNPGDFQLLSPQYVLYDGRTSYVNFHNSHTAPHNFSSANAFGERTTYPSIVPFNSGWLSIQAIATYSYDAHYSPLTDVRLHVVYIAQDGQFVWERDYTPVDFGSTVLNVANGITSLVDTYRDVKIVAGNNNNRILYCINDWTTNVNRHFWADFDSAGNFTKTFAWDQDAATGTGFETAFTAPTVFTSGSGYVIHNDIRGGTNQSKVMCLNANLELVNILDLGIPSGGTKWMVPTWAGDGVPSVVRYSSGVLTVHPVVFDGVNPGTAGASYGDTIASTTGDWNWGGQGLTYVDNWNVGAGTKPPDHWSKRASGPKTVIPNHNNLEWVYLAERNFAYMASNWEVVSTIVTDWYGVQPVSSTYSSGPAGSGDKFALAEYAVRFNTHNWGTGQAGYIDLILKNPSPPSIDYGDWDGYDDNDMDDPPFAVVHPHTGRVLMWHYAYWRMQARVDGGGYPSGDNTATTYWILGPEPAAATPIPGWVEVFGSTGGGTGTGSALVSDGGPCIDCGQLGVGKHRVFLYDRGGAQRIAEITDLALVRWRRIRDDISDATVIVNSPSPECCAVLASIATGRHEIVIFRDNDRVWEGPITRTSFKSTSVEIAAHDICHYLSRTIMRRAYDNRYSAKNSKVGPVTKRAQIILATELARKEALSPPVNILRFLDVRTHPKTTRTSRLTKAYQSTVWEEMDYLAAKLSLDYTTIGRRLMVFDTHDIIGRSQILTDADFTDELIVSEYGMELATRSAVTDGEGRWAAVGGNDPFYGEVELLHNMYGEEVSPLAGSTPTKEELAALAREMTSQAQRNLAGRYPVPTVVRVPDNTQLDPKAPICINGLVPGIRVPIRATLACKVLQQEQKLDRVTVTEDQSGESVAITLSPAPGETPWDDDSESTD